MQKVITQRDVSFLGQAALVLVTGPLAGVVSVPRLSPHLLTGDDFFNYSSSASPSNDARIATVGYRSALQFTMNKCCNGVTQQVSLNVSKLAATGYGAVAIAVGAGDGSAVGTGGEVRIMRDGKIYRTLHVPTGQTAQRLVVPFNGHAVITFVVVETAYGTGDAATVGTAYYDVVFGNPTAIVSLAAYPVGSPPATPSLRLTLTAPSVAAGAVETARVTTTPGSYVTVIVPYPSGTPRVLGPLRTDAAGKVSTTFSPPSGVHGQTGVVAVANDQVAHDTFTVE